MAVIDGATPKSPRQESDTARFLSAIVRALSVADYEELSPTGFLEECARQIERVGPFSRALDEMPSATVAVVSGYCQQVWRLGDPWIAIDGVVNSPRHEREEEIAGRRAARVREILGSGVSVADIKCEDLARQELMDDLRALSKWRNHPSGSGFGALDASEPSIDYLEIWSLPDGSAEVVLATDGYLSPAPTLMDAERELADRIRNDPLMISSPPATKGVMLNAESFDDRTYLRVEI